MSVLLAYAPASAARADHIAERLKTLGFAVDQARTPAALTPLERRRFAAAIAAAKAVLVLWPARATAALRALAREAKRAGKLVLARLDRGRPPLRAPMVDLRFDNSRAMTALAAALKGNAPMTETTPMPRSTRLEGAGVMLVLALVIATAVYFTDAPFAARVNNTMHEAQTGAMALIDKIKG